MGTTSVNKTLSRVQILDKGNRLETYHEVEEKSHVLTFTNERDLALLNEQRSQNLLKSVSSTATVVINETICNNYETIRFEKLSTSAFLINFSKHCSCRKN